MHDRRRLRRPSPALVVATVALVVSLTGTAAAGGLLNNEVRSQHIANGQVKRADIAANAIDSPLVRDGSLIAADIQNGTLSSSDLRDGSLTGADIADGSLTSAELADASVLGVDVAADALTGDDVDEATLRGVMPAAVRVVQAEIASVADGSGATVAATCAANERAIGGGAAWLVPATDTASTGAATISASMPELAAETAEPAGWRAAGTNASGGPLAFRAYAFCSVRT